jgi:hypothetical protein
MVIIEIVKEGFFMSENTPPSMLICFSAMNVKAQRRVRLFAILMFGSLETPTSKADVFRV